ncbi:MAG: XrtA system polysaccharide chain length determinant [Terriglobales bacterium]
MLEELDEKNSETFNFEHYWAIVRRRHWYFLIPFFLGWAVVWGASWLMPSVYRSGTLILVEQPTVPQQYVTPNVSDNLQDRLQSITQQILSRTRLLHIIQQLNLYSAASQRSNPDELVERMRKDIEIPLVRSSDGGQLTAFNVFYSSRDPHIAQEVTRQLTDFFISQNLEVRQQQSEDTTKFLENQLEEARKTLADQEQKVRDFKDQHLGELPGQLQGNLQILAGLQAQLQSEEDALFSANQQNSYLQSLIQQYRSSQRSAKASDGAPLGLPAIDQKLEKLRAQLADLESHYTDRHPDVRKAKEEIAETEKMKQQLEANLTANASHPPSTTPTGADPADLSSGSPLRQLQNQLEANKIEIANRQRAISELKAKIGAGQAHLNQEPVREQQLSELTRGYDQSQANYDDLLKKKNESELATSMELRQQGEHFQVLDPPSLPMTPYSPNRLKLCGIGLFAGIVLGGVFTAGAELMDDRLYTEKDLKELIHADVISEIPNIITADEEKKRKRVVHLQWVSTAAVFAVIAAGCAFSYFRG